MHKPSDKKEIDCHDSDLYWPTSIKDKIQWFPFITIMEYTANILNPNKGLIPSLLKVFSMSELSLIDDGDKAEAIDNRCINCKNRNRFILRNFNIRRNDY